MLISNSFQKLVTILKTEIKSLNIFCLKSTPKFNNDFGIILSQLKSRVGYFSMALSASDHLS
jgi:hypothetical protein